MRNQVLIDSHAHAQFAAYDADRDEVMKRALESRVGIINVGTLFSTSLAAVRLAEKYKDGVWATVGFHPSHAAPNAHHDTWEAREKNGGSFDYEAFRKLAKHPKVVAVGECGLDYYRLEGDAVAVKEKQKQVLESQLKLAAEVSKPLTLHCRPSKGTADAYDDLHNMLAASAGNFQSGLRGVVHFFAGNTATAKKFLDLGFYISFAGPITFASEYEDVVKYVPLDRILVETDAPYASPAPYRGKRNEPLYVFEISKKIAELHGLSFEEVSSRTLGNTKELFRI